MGDPFLFEDLPTDLQEAIYDKLHITDRQTLNSVLHPKRRITKTIHTNQKKDKTLAALHAIFKKERNVNVSRIPDRIVHFIEEHSEDATIRQIIGSRHFSLFNKNNPYWQLAVFKHKMKHALVDDDIVRIMPILHDKKDAFSDVVKVMNHITPQAFDTLMGNEHIRQFMNDDIYAHDIQCMMFCVINHNNSALLDHILDKYRNEPFACTAMAYLQQPRILSILWRGGTSNTWQKHFTISHEVKRAILERAIENFDIDIIMEMSDD